MYAVAVTEPDQVEIIDIPKPDIGQYQALVKTEVSTLCNATDRKLIKGKFPGVDDYPLILGHESVGIVEETGDKVRYFDIGDRVLGGLILEPPKYYNSAWGGFSEYILVTDHKAMVEDGTAKEEHGWAEVYEIQSKITKFIPIEAAVLLCTWREVYGSLSDFNIPHKENKGSKYLIFGAGPVGLTFVKVLKNLGIGFVGVVDPLEIKREKALELGADSVFSLNDNPLKTEPINSKVGFDGIIDAVGKESIINEAISMLKMNGDICVYGVIDKSNFTVNKHKGPYNFNLFVHQWPNRTQEIEAQKPLVRWIKEGKLDYKDFITAEFSIKNINEAIKASNKGKDLKILLKYD